jgi:hypothetical protein
MIVPGKPFHPSLMFHNKGVRPEPTEVENLSGAPL